MRLQQCQQDFLPVAQGRKGSWSLLLTGLWSQISDSQSDCCWAVSGFWTLLGLMASQATGSRRILWSSAMLVTDKLSFKLKQLECYSVAVLMSPLCTLLIVLVP